MTLSSSETDTAVSGIQHPVLVAVVAIIITTVLYNFATELVGPRAWSGFPIVGKEEGEWTNKAAQKRWYTQSRKLLKQGLDKVNDYTWYLNGSASLTPLQFSGPFQLFNPSGPLLVIPPKYADEIRNDERLSFNAFMEKVSCSNLKSRVALF